MAWKTRRLTAEQIDEVISALYWDADFCAEVAHDTNDAVERAEYRTRERLLREIADIFDRSNTVEVR